MYILSMVQSLHRRDQKNIQIHQHQPSQVLEAAAVTRGCGQCLPLLYEKIFTSFKLYTLFFTLKGFFQLLFVILYLFLFWFFDFSITAQRHIITVVIAWHPHF